MSVAVGRRRRTVPPVTARPDPGHPLSASLVGCHLPLPGRGAIALNGVAPMTLIGTPVRVNTSWGKGMSHTANAMGASNTIGTTSPLCLNPPLTIMWVGNVLASLPNNVDAYGVNFDTGNNDPFRCYMLGTQSNNTWELFGNAGSVGTFWTLNSGVNTTGRQVVVGVVEPAAQAIWVNGVRQATATNTVSTIDYGSVSNIRFGTKDGTGNQQISSAFGCVWRRALSAAEIAALWTDPFQMLRF